MDRYGFEMMKSVTPDEISEMQRRIERIERRLSLTEEAVQYLVACIEKAKSLEELKEHAERLRDLKTYLDNA